MERFKQIVVIWVILLVSPPFSSLAKTVLNVSNQKEFDGISSFIERSVSDNRNRILIILKPGSYVASEKHIHIRNINNKGLQIKVKGGNGVIVLPDGKSYIDGERYIGDFSYMNSWMNDDIDIDNWTRAHYAEGIIEVIDEKTKRCRLKTTERYTNKAFPQNSYILIPSWFRSWVYKVDKIDGQYIYFNANNLGKSSLGGYNVNDDYNYAKGKIRYKLCNFEECGADLKIIDGKVVLPEHVHTVREGQVGNFLSIDNCTIKSLDISGIEFRGFSGKNNDALLSFKGTECKRVSIHDCAFLGVRPDVIRINSTSNVQIYDNLFRGCYNNGIDADNLSGNVVVQNNHFYKMGKRMSSSFCVSCSGKNYRIRNNFLEDYGYGGVRVGVWYGAPKHARCYGTVENNCFRCSDEYIANRCDYGLMDSGVIYVFSKNDGAIIRGNIIQNYAGIKDNRGIFCDDGAYNVQIYGNVITGNNNSYCIDSRRVSSVETKITPSSGITRANVNVVIKNNIVDGAIRFEGHEDAENGCIQGENYLLKRNGKDAPKSTYVNVKNDTEDKLIESDNIGDGAIVLGNNSYRVLRNSDSWKWIKHYIQN